MNFSIDEKWGLVKTFYERNYRHEDGKHMRFSERPNDFVINSLFGQMVKVHQFFKDFYFQHEKLFENLQSLRGMGPSDSVKKREPHQ